VTQGEGTIVRRYADGMRRKGAQITLRRTTITSGASNPPILINPRLDGAALSGATTIAIRADHAVGRLVVGDKLKIGTLAAIAVAAQATARAPSMNPAVVTAPGFTSVTLASGLPAGAADGAVIVPTWLADQVVYGSVQTNSTRLGQTQQIDGDFVVNIPSYGVTSVPEPQGRIEFGGTWYTITQVVPTLHRDIVAGWVVGAAR